MALQKTTFHLPLAAGLDTKRDPRALDAPSLAVCKNAEFDEVGGIQKRKPYASIGTNILGGGTISGIRKVVSNGDELLAFTAEALYSWSVRDTAWVLKATYLAPKVTERSVFVDPTEQVSTDRCEVGSCVIYTWVVNHATATSRRVWVAAKDKTTGAVVLPPTQPNASSVVGVDRPRLVALASKALLFFIDSNDDLVVIGLTPATLAADLAVASTLILDTADHTDKYDVVSDGTTAFFAAVRNPTTSYEVGTVSSALAIARATKARTADDCIAVSAPSSTGSRFVVARPVVTDMRGDVLNSSTLADVSVNVALGTASSATVNQITACYRSAQVAGEWSCHVFWSAGETANQSSAFQCGTNTINNAGAAGTESLFLRETGVASRAFDHNGRVFLWGVFAGESSAAGLAGPAGLRAALQNTYFLYRDDGLLIAKAGSHKAAGFRSLAGHLPGVQSTGVYVFCGGERRIISVSTKHSSYSARAPRDVSVQFDTNEARRCARLGPTLYVTGGEVRQYDGTNLVEVGFHVYPWSFAGASLNAGSLGAGDYTYKFTYRWDNANGERDRSTTASHDIVTVSASEQVDFGLIVPLRWTHKTRVAIEGWRTVANPVIDSPFYLVTNQDPTVVTGDNEWQESDPTASSHAIADDYPDATLTTKEANPENGGILENLAPPPASIIVATQDRIILAGISDNPYRIVYSHLRGESEVAAFHDTLYVDVPPTGGAITGLGFLNETLVAFCETAIFALPGDGFDNLGQGSNYGPARLLSSDVGATTHESIALTPSGLLFQSDKGIYLLGSGWGLDYIGGPVSEFNDDVSAVHVMESRHQVRILSAAGWVVVWDYLVNQWSEWTIGDGIDATIWQGTYHYATSAAVKAEQGSYSSADYSLDLETAWIKLDGLMGFQRIWYLQVLGEYRSAHDLRIRIARDYSDSDSAGPTWIDDKFWSPDATTVGGRLQVRHGLKSPQQCQAIKIRLTDYADGSTTTPPAGEALRLTALALEVGVKPRGLYKQLASGAKQ
jgi:hypothetical protein